MPPSALVDPAATASLALLSVSLWTGRVALTAKGRKAASALVAAVEATIFVVAFSRLLTGLDSPIRIVAYAAGVAGGTLLALTVESVINPQVVKLDIIDSTGPGRVLTALHDEGWPTTVLRAEGLTAPIDVVSVTATEARLPALLRTVGWAAPDAFWTVTSVRQVGAAEVPSGFTQVAQPGRWWSPKGRTIPAVPVGPGGPRRSPWRTYDPPPMNRLTTHFEPVAGGALDIAPRCTRGAGLVPAEDAGRPVRAVHNAAAS
jgi:uncharacterized protein YebE (UPF0316 family)